MQKVMFVGIGKRGEHCWLKLLLERKDIKITSIVEPNLSRHEELRVNYPDLAEAHWYEDLDSALEAGEAAETDFAVVTTPPMSHYEISVKLMDQGVDVLCEKPTVVLLEDAIKMAEQAKKQNRFLWITQNFRFAESSQFLLNRVRSGEMGSAEMGTIAYHRNRDGKADWLNKYPLTMEYPMLLEQSEHHYDLMRYCYDREVVKIYSRMMNPSWSMYANQATVNTIFEMERGMLVNYWGSWSSSHGYFDFQWRTDFAKGAIIQKQLFSDVYVGKPDSEKLERMPIDIKPEDVMVSDARILLDKFVNRKQLTDLRGIPDIYDNLLTLALVFATIESDRDSKAIYMDEFYKREGITPFIRKRGLGKIVK